MEFYFMYILMGIILLPGLIYASVVSAKVNSAFKTYSSVCSSKGITAKQACEMILRNAGVNDVKIVEINGHLTDNYNTSNKTLSLSQSVYNSTSISALGVAAHEAGHAIQHAEGYAPLKMRHAIGTLSNFCSSLLWPLLIIGIVLGLLLCFLQQKFGLISLGGGNGSFVVDAYPVSVHLTDVLLVFVTVIAVGFLSVWYPVKYLSRRLLSATSSE